MPAKRELSIFDIIGPIMVGPSSSHTAGAVRLGRLAREILGRQPEFARIELHGSFAQTGSGHGTDKAVLAGLLGLPTHDSQLRFSDQAAEAAGMDFVFTTIDLGDQAHPNSLRLTLRAGDEQVVIEGASVGGGLVEINQIQGYPIRFDGSYNTLILFACDQVGTISSISRLLSKNNINIAFLSVERAARGGEVMMSIEIDNELSQDLLAQIIDLDWVHWVRLLPRVEV